MINNLDNIFKESNLYTKLIKNNINNIKELILKKPKKYQNFILSKLDKIENKDKLNLYGIIKQELITVNNFFKKNIKMFQILTSQNITLKVIIFNNFFF
ncbi:MAG: hypothetical protein Q2306_00730 [Phytoplasma sp.]|uniref:hypothetical protein n=1 Tax=Phytoplasma sp. TaxID=2155 RepID=UPI002B40C476|nr:hypothetical protein [Phytoplasma sp.]WRH06855.1 MAG: hypothetical protein Q2306_00730 [Phytoplasma sp.]